MYTLTLASSNQELWHKSCIFIWSFTMSLESSCLRQHVSWHKGSSEVIYRGTKQGWGPLKGAISAGRSFDGLRPRNWVTLLEGTTNPPYWGISDFLSRQISDILPLGNCVNDQTTCQIFQMFTHLHDICDSDWYFSSEKEEWRLETGIASELKEVGDGYRTWLVPEKVISYRCCVQQVLKGRPRGSRQYRNPFSTNAK